MKSQFVSALSDPPSLQRLEQRMVSYYTDSAKYYQDISDSANRWNGENEEYRTVYEWIKDAPRLGEIGCGQAFILGEHPELEARYSGVDFSPELLAANRTRHPKAKFVPLTDGRKFPLADGSCDAVFSMWVIEHAVRPQEFLDECLRVLAPGGKLAILTPDILGLVGLSSIRYGLPNVAYGPVDGDWKYNLKERGVWAGAKAFYRSRFLVPRVISHLRAEADADRGFLINLEPICFEPGRPFQPDVDAVYMTYEPEIRRRLEAAGCTVEPVFAPATARKHILLRATKR